MATVTTPAGPAPQPEPASAVGRIFGVFFSPRAAFESIARRPTWLAPLIVVTVISFGMNVVLAKRVDWRAYTQTQLEKTGRSDQVPNEQAMNRVVMGQKFSRYVRGVVGDTLAALFSSAIYLGIFNLLFNAELKFKSVLSVICFTMMPTALKELLGIGILYLKDPATINPDNFIASGLGAFLGSNVPNWLMVLGITVDLFVFWGMILAVIGFHSLNPKKIKTGTALGAVVGVYLFFVLLAVGVTAAFS
jgi:Yip1-like protein